MAPNYKLTYFNIRGLAEGARLLFAAAGVEYEDNRLADGTWADLKPTTPFGKLPLLEVDGKTIPQSRALERYLAKKFDMYGKDIDEQTQVDVVIETLRDFTEGMGPLFKEKDEAKKAEMMKEYEKTMTDILTNLEKMTPDTGYFVGSKISWADTAFLHYMGIPGIAGATVPPMSNYPKLNKILENVKAHPGVAAWIEKRPDTKM